MVGKMKNDFVADSEGEFSLIDILHFFKGAYKTIFLTLAAGLAIAALYVATTPKQYEAIAQIGMAQLGTLNTNNGLSPNGINIEEPASLILRLTASSSFPQNTIVACGFEGIPEPGATLAKAIKLRANKVVVNVVELKTYGVSPSAAKDCATSIFELIKSTQLQMLSPYLDEARIQLTENQLRLEKARDLVSRADKSGLAIGASYLSTRDEIHYLLDRVAQLKNLVNTKQSRVTQLITPIDVSNAPVSPKKEIALVVGLFGGLFLGLLIALVCQTNVRLKD